MCLSVLGKMSSLMDDKAQFVLILNRRCIKHSQRGGAERYTLAVAEALRDAGYKVIWFASSGKGLRGVENIEGITFLRRGSELTVHLWGILYCLQTRPYVVIDEFNGVGFFTFLLDNSVLLIHQLYEEFWNVEYGVFGYIFRFIEKTMLRLYSRKPVITVSESTKKDLVELGFSGVSIVPNGLDIKPMEHVPSKNERLTLVFLGRMKKTKNPEDAIKCFLEVKRHRKDAMLNMIGDGPELERLRDMYSGVVSFKGYLPDDEKYELLKKAHFLLVPSVREGWGQVVIQANAVGTPAIGYDVPGLRDSIRHKETGFLVRDYYQMARSVMFLYENRALYAEICRNALMHAMGFSWERTKTGFIEWFESKVRKRL